MLTVVVSTLGYLTFQRRPSIAGAAIFLIGVEFSRGTRTLAAFEVESS